MTVSLLLYSIALLAVSGLPGFFLPRRSVLGQWIAMGLNVLASCVGGAAIVIRIQQAGGPDKISFAWGLPLGRFAVAVDDLSLIFLIPFLLVSMLGSIYGLSYWSQSRHPGNGRTLRFSWGLMTAAMMLVVLARDSVLFLMAWEIMALAAYFLVTSQDEKSEVRQAGWIYLATAHVGLLCLFGFFALLRQLTGSFELWNSMRAVPSHGVMALFVLGAVGFGFKAGIVPLHVWLPGAHANAPSHVSALLSGCMLNAGIYGLVRLGGLFWHPPLWWGATLLTFGTISALVGISFAAAQRDLKRLLAYSSIENMGIIVMGLGLACMGRSLNRIDWMVLGLAAALLHMLNHSLFKPLLFMGAGSILHATGTRQIDQLGGLARTMPRTFVLLVAAALAICGLPPLNGFVSEFFLYLGLLRTAAYGVRGSGWAALAAPALAMVGALAVVSFVKFLGVAFAGSARTKPAENAHDPKLSMLGPMLLLAICCVLIGLVPVYLAGLFDRALVSWLAPMRAPAAELGDFVPFSNLAICMGLLLAISAFVGIFIWWLRTGRPVSKTTTWGCGYARPNVRMQYTGSSFSQMLVHLLRWVLWPRKKLPEDNQIFPGPADFKSDVPDVILDRGLLPAISVAQRAMNSSRSQRRGSIQVYLLCMLGILLILFLIA